MEQKVRVCIQAADKLSKLGLERTLQNATNIRVVDDGRRDRAQVLIVLTDRLNPSILATLRQNLATLGQVPVVLVVEDIEAEELLAASECRIVGVVHRDAATTAHLRQIVRLAASGGAMYPPALLSDLISHVERLVREFTDYHGKNRSTLSGREIEILRLLAEGYDTAEVAEQLSYSERTIKNILSGTLIRLNLRNRAHAVAYGLRAGLF